MSRSLARTIYSLAKYETYHKSYGEDEVPLLTEFLSVWNSLALSEESSTLILAADRLIGYLLAYRGEISIGQKYFQPLCSRKVHFPVSFKWDDRNKCAFCAGCYYTNEECRVSPFSSICSRFRIAWAIEHVTVTTNKLVKLIDGRKEHPND
jgi:hypothetical protein